MTIVASTDFEAGTAGNSVPTNGSDCFNAGSVVGTGTAKYVAAHAHSGTKSMQLHTAATTDQAFRTVTFTAQAVTAVRGYFTFTSAPSANMDFLSLYSATTKIGDVRLMATGAITLRNVNTQVAASAALATNTLYRWEWRVAPDPTTGTQSFRIFSGLNIESTSSWDAQITGAASGSAATSATEVRLHISGGPIADLWVDDYAIADDWVGATSKSIDAAVAITANDGADMKFNPGVVGASRAATAVATADGTVVHIGAGTIVASTGFQAGTVGANVPTNSTDLFDAGSAVGGGTATYDNQHTHLATTRSMQLDCPAATDQIFRSRTITAAATGAARMYFTINALPAAITQIWAAYLTNAKVADVRITPAGLLTIRNVNTVVDTAAAALVPGTLYRLEWKVAPNATGGTQSLKIASGAKLDVSSQADETLTGAATGSGATQVDEFRVSLFGAAARAWVDDYAVGSGDYLGASLNGKVIDAASLVTAAAVAAPAGVVVVINAPGAAVAAVAAAGVTTNVGGVVDWVVKTVKVWNGSAWVVKPVKVWNGSAWVTKTVKVQHFVPVVGNPYNIGGSSRATAAAAATAQVTHINPPPPSGIIYGATQPGVPEETPSTRTNIIRCYNASDLAATSSGDAVAYASSSFVRAGTRFDDLRGANGAAAQTTAVNAMIGYWNDLRDEVDQYADLWHEPDNGDPVTGAQIVAAMDVVIARVKPGVNQGRTHPVKFGNTFTGQFFSTGHASDGTAVDTWIGNGWGWLGADIYYTTATATNAAAVATRNGIPIWMHPEVGTSVQGNPPDTGAGSHLVHMQALKAFWEGMNFPPKGVCWFEQNHNRLWTRLAIAAQAGDTTITVRGIPGKGTGPWSMANGAPIKIDPHGSAENKTLTQGTSQSGGDNSAVLHVTALANDHASGAVVWLMPTSIAYWRGL